MGLHRVGHDWSDLAAAAATTGLSGNFPSLLILCWLCTYAVATLRSHKILAVNRFLAFVLFFTIWFLARKFSLTRTKFFFFFLIIELEKSEVKVAQLCLTLCHPMDYIVYGILQARIILEWAAFPFPRDLPNPWVEPRSPALQSDSLSAEPQGAWEVHGKFPYLLQRGEIWFIKIFFLSLWTVDDIWVKMNPRSVWVTRTNAWLGRFPMTSPKNLLLINPCFSGPLLVWQWLFDGLRHLLK